MYDKIQTNASKRNNSCSEYLDFVNETNILHFKNVVENCFVMVMHMWDMF